MKILFDHSLEQEGKEDYAISGNHDFVDFNYEHSFPIKDRKERDSGTKQTSHSVYTLLYR